MLRNYIIMALKYVHAYLIEVAFDAKCKDQGYQRKTMQSQQYCIGGGTGGAGGAFAPPTSQLGGHCPPYFAAQYI